MMRSAGRLPKPARAPNPPAANTALSRSVRNLFQIGSLIATLLQPESRLYYPEPSRQSRNNAATCPAEAIPAAVARREWVLGCHRYIFGMAMGPYLPIIQALAVVLGNRLQIALHCLLIVADNDRGDLGTMLTDRSK